MQPLLLEAFTFIPVLPQLDLEEIHSVPWLSPPNSYPTTKLLSTVPHDLSVLLEARGSCLPT